MAWAAPILIDHCHSKPSNKQSTESRGTISAMNHPQAITALLPWL